MQCRHLFGKGRLGREGAAGKKWKSGRVADQVRMAIASMRRDGEVYGRGRLGCFREHRSAGGCGNQDLASGQHESIMTSVAGRIKGRGIIGIQEEKVL